MKLQKKSLVTRPSSARPTPRSGRVAQERRASVLKAAAQVFLKKGFGAASMSDIIAKAGGSKASMYGHFHSKDELFSAVMRQEIAQRSLLLFDVSDANSNIEDTLATIGQRFLQLLIDDTSQALHRICLHEATTFPELGLLFFESGPKTFINRMSEVLREANKKGQLRVNDPEIAAWQYALLCQAKYIFPFIMTGIAKPTPRQCQEAIGAAVRTFMAAFGPRA